MKAKQTLKWIASKPVHFSPTQCGRGFSTHQFLFRPNQFYGFVRSEAAVCLREKDFTISLLYLSLIWKGCAVCEDEQRILQFSNSGVNVHSPGSGLKSVLRCYFTCGNLDLCSVKLEKINFYNFFAIGCLVFLLVCCHISLKFSNLLFVTCVKKNSSC